MLSSYNIQKNLAFLFIYLLLYIYIYIYLINFKLDKEIFTDYKVWAREEKKVVNWNKHKIKNER